MLGTLKTMIDYQGETDMDETIGNQQVTECELAWLAGIYDGEGWFSLRTKKAGMDFPKDGVNLAIGVVNTDTSIIDKVDSILTRLGVSHYLMERAHDRWKTRYDISIRKFSAAKLLLEKVIPYLVAKDGQARILLRFVNRRLSLPKYARYDADDAQIVSEYAAMYARHQEPQRLHAKAPAGA